MTPSDNVEQQIDEMFEGLKLRTVKTSRVPDDFEPNEDFEIRGLDWMLQSEKNQLEERKKTIKALLVQERIREHDHIAWNPNEATFIEHQADRIGTLRDELISSLTSDQLKHYEIAALEEGTKHD